MGSPEIATVEKAKITPPLPADEYDRDKRYARVENEERSLMLKFWVDYGVVGPTKEDFDKAKAKLEKDGYKKKAEALQQEWPEFERLIGSKMRLTELEGETQFTDDTIVSARKIPAKSMESATRKGAKLYDAEQKERSTLEYTAQEGEKITDAEIAKKSELMKYFHDQYKIHGPTMHDYRQAMKVLNDRKDFDTAEKLRQDHEKFLQWMRLDEEATKQMQLDPEKDLK